MSGHDGDWEGDPLMEVAQAAFDALTQDAGLQGSLTARGFVPLLDWASDRSLAVAAACSDGLEPAEAAERSYDLLRRWVQAAVWAAERSDAQLLILELKACPPSVVVRATAVRALLRLPLQADADANAEAIAHALDAAAPRDSA